MTKEQHKRIYKAYYEFMCSVESVHLIAFCCGVGVMSKEELFEWTYLRLIHSRLGMLNRFNFHAWYNNLSYHEKLNLLS